MITELPQHARSCTYFDLLHRLEQDGDLVGELGEQWCLHLSDCTRCRQRAIDEAAVMAIYGEATPRLSARRHEEILAAVVNAEPGGSSADAGVRAELAPVRSAFARKGWAGAFLAAASLIGVVLGWGLARSSEPVEPARVAQSEAGRHLQQAVTLAQLRDPLASRRLSAIFEIDSQPRVDEAALAAILWRLEFDPNVNVRLTAAKVVAGEVDRPGVADALITSFDRGPDPLVRLALIEILGRSGSNASQTVLRALRDAPRADRAVREQAASSLGQAEASNRS